MISNKHQFTIFTPCYNGEKTIQRVFDSVESQTYTDFEWIIINDGSNDNSDTVIQTLIKKSPIKNKIRYFSQENLGKHRTWNKAVDLSRGEIFLSADADESFLPITLECFNDHLNQIENIYGNLNQISGVNVCVYDPLTGKLRGKAYPKNGMVSDNVELTYKYKILDEHWGCIRTALLKQYKFPEVKGHFYTESRLWFMFAKKGYKVVCYNDPLRAYFYEANSLTNNKSHKRNINCTVMFLRFHLWTIFNLGWRIFKYSPIEYLKIWKQVAVQMIRYVLLSLSKS